MKKLFFASSAAAALLLTGCVNSGISVTGADGQAIAASNTLSITDLEQTNLAEGMVQSIMAYHEAGRLFANPNSRYVIAIGRLENKTTNIRSMRTFEETVKEKIMELLPNVTVTDSIRYDGKVDEMQDAAEEIRGDARFDQSKVVRGGGMYGFSQSLLATLTNDYVPLKGNKVEVTYKLVMKINDTRTGTTLWSKTTKITKVGSRKDITW